MTVNNMKISKDGRITGDVWSTRDREYDRGVDLTDMFLMHLNRECEIDDGVKMRDVLHLIRNVNAYELLSPIFTHSPCWLEEIVNEGLDKNPSLDSDIEKVVVSWRSSVNDDYYAKGESIIDTYISVGGIAKDTDEIYALDFSSMDELVDCDVVLDKTFEIFDERKDILKDRQKYIDSIPYGERSKETYYPSVLKTKKSFTLFHILNGIFWEFSFHGGPKERATRRDELLEQVKRIESGEEETYSMEEVRDILKQKSEGDK